VRPGVTRELSFKARTPGTYFYWGTTTRKAVADRGGIDSQLHGALIVDDAGRAPRPDRVFVLADWIGPAGSAAGYNPELRVINGLSWSHTEFYSKIPSRGTWAGLHRTENRRSSARRDRDAHLRQHLRGGGVREPRR
jgi:hypothetical protein